MKRILVIEDEDILCKLYTQTLTSAGYEVSGVRSGEAGLKSIGISPPDLVLLDLLLPGGMDGFEFLDRMRQNPQTVSTLVVIFTNIISEIAHAKTVGAAEVLIKSEVNMENLVRIIKLHLPL